MTNATSDTAARIWLYPGLLTLLLISSLALKLVNLGHRGINGLDESFHAVVARNLLDDPLKPALIAKPFIAYDATDWMGGHVWLHKPILPLWQIAVSFFVLGVNTFALRLPSAILSTVACLLTYLIGRDLVDRRAGLIACALQAFNPAILMLVNGYAFSDHVDISLLFWTELSIWLLCISVARASRPCAEQRAPDTGETPVLRWSWIPILCGAAQGCAFLSKTYPALIITVLAMVLVAMNRDRRSVRTLMLIVVGTLLVAGPWTTYTWVRFPTEFLAENGRILQHLGTNIENFAGPWDRVVFDFLLRAMHRFYPACLVAIVLMVVEVINTRDRKLAPLLTWVIGTIAVFTLAISKPPNATLIAWPGMLIVFGWMVSRAISGDVVCLTCWLVTMSLGALFQNTIAARGWGFPESGRSAGVMGENVWVLWHAIAALGAGLITMIAFKLKGKLKGTRPFICTADKGSCPLYLRVSWRGAVAVAGFASVWLSVQLGRVSWRVTQINDSSPSYRQLSIYAKDNLPANAVLLIDEGEKFERNVAMFWTGRTCYPIGERTWQDVGREIKANGGLPYVVSFRELPLKPIAGFPEDQRMLYEWKAAEE